jgi:hypothetical protein
MRKLAMRLWRDDAGFVVSTELVLVATILVIGVTIGQATLRDAVISELADTAGAINDINQSYSYSTVTGHSSSVSGSLYDDKDDFCDSADGVQGAQTGSASGACVNFDDGTTDTDG